MKWAVKKINDWCVEAVIHDGYLYLMFLTSNGMAGLEFWSFWRSNVIHWVQLDPGKTLFQLSHVDHTSLQEAQIMTLDILIKEILNIDIRFLLHFSTN